MTTRENLQRQFFDMLMESQFWSPEALRDYQRSQLAQLLRHARANVPFYQHRLDAVVKPNGDIDWDRWGEIPIVRRQDVAEHGEAMLASSFPTAHGGTTQSTTSGSSGAPITLTSTRLAHVALNANRFRAYDWHGIDTTKVCCSILGEDPAQAWPDGAILGPWGPQWDTDSIDGALIRINRLTPVPQLLDFFRRKRPAYLTTGPKSALALALEVEALGEDWHFDAFLPHGSMLDDEDRAAVKRVFGATSVDLYSSKEAGHIAHGCPQAGGLHVNTESLLLELVDDDGRPVSAGQPGRVVVTPFFNAAQPLIRYDQGDVASWMGPCSCGRHLGRIDGLIGRTNTVFYHPDGRVRVAFMGHHRHLLNCLAWQIAQTGPTQFEVRYVPGDAAGDEETLRARLRDAYFEDAEIRFRKLDSIPLSPGGKPIEYANEWRPEAR